MNRLSLNRKVIALGLAATFAIGVGLTAVRPSDAQGPTTGRFNPSLITACSTTDYTDVAAKALGITSTELRVDLVSGKTLTAVASSKNVQMQTLMDAFNAARKADLDQAVKDGLLTQEQADAMSSRRLPRQRRGQQATPAPTQSSDQQATQAPTQPSAQTPAAPGAPGPRSGFFGFPGTSGFGFGLAARAGFSVEGYHSIKVLPVAAQAIGISCGDLVKALGQRQTIAQVATSKNVTAQTVIDALVKARTAALAQDVSDGLRTQAESAGQSVNLSREYTAVVNGTGGASLGFFNSNSASPFGGGGRLGNLFNLFRQYFRRGIGGDFGPTGLSGTPAPTAAPTQPAA